MIYSLVFGPRATLGCKQEKEEKWEWSSKLIPIVWKEGGVIYKEKARQLKVVWAW